MYLVKVNIVNHLLIPSWCDWR